MYRFFDIVRRRKSRLTSGSRRLQARPNLEELEGRRQPAVVVSPFVPGVVEVSTILGNLYVQQLEQGNIGTGGTLPQGPAAGPEGAIGAGGTAGQGTIPFTTLTLGLQFGKGSTVAPPFNTSSTTPSPTLFVPSPPAPTQVVSPAVVEPHPLFPTIPVPEGAGNGQKPAEGTPAEPGATPGAGQVPSQPGNPPTQNPQGAGQTPPSQSSNPPTQNPQGAGQTPPSQSSNPPPRVPEGAGQTPPNQPSNPPTQNPEPMGLRLLEEMSPVTVVWGTPAGLGREAAGPFRGFSSADGNGSLLRADLPPQEGQRVDQVSAVAAIALGLVQIGGMEQELARDGKGPAGRTRRDE